MKWGLIVVLIILCGCATHYNPQPIVLKDLSKSSAATREGPLRILAKTYKSNSVDFKKAGLHGVFLSFQVTGIPAHTYQFMYSDIVGIGKQTYKPYPKGDVIARIYNSDKLKESGKGAAAGVGVGGAIGAALGAILGAFGGNPGTGAALGAASGAAVGGASVPSYYVEKLREAATEEVENRGFDYPITVMNRADGVIFFPHDVKVVEILVDYKPVRVPIR
jgi:hypothetical protein